MENKKLCIYHGNCADGFSAAWVVWTVFGDVCEYYGGVHGTPPPDVTGKDVILVDFSYKREVILQMAQKANSILILDHHKTAMDDLKGFPDYVELPNEKVVTIFDMERSGAMIAWDHFFPTLEAPQLLKHVQDRDLWNFKLEGTEEVQINLFSYDYNFHTWDKLMNMNSEELEIFKQEGKALKRKHMKDIHELLGVVTRPMKIAGHVVPIANLPYTMTSEAGHLLSKQSSFAGCYWDTPSGRSFSLRSQKDGGLDVGEIAVSYGGGGHKNASGFVLPFDEARKLEFPNG